MRSPAYFEQVQNKAGRRWQQLESDEELAGPWHQLFRQVQSPRHVLSELLQNADDAGATEASATIEDGVFIFSHDGSDFTPENFSSLCSFGYSNKRCLHTIGFRGIGFKSTFSLGETVELITPTLSVAFHRERFTYPEWIESASARHETGTIIRSRIQGEGRLDQVCKNLDEWLTDPIPLLFFNNIRKLRINNKEIRWDSAGPGPISNTEWLINNNDLEKPFLVARSLMEPFPQEAIDEIKSERSLPPDSDFDFPPCKIEIVLGAKGRLYTVLPTGVLTSLPFALNGPFIQDPARLLIKDPDMSPTNRWLLARIGAFAAQTMIKYLQNSKLRMDERCEAYDFLPNSAIEGLSIESSCGYMVEYAFKKALTDTAILLTNNGDLKSPNECAIFPRDLFDVWDPSIVNTFDANGRIALSREVGEINCRKLINNGLIQEITRDRVISVLQTTELPEPSSWERLLTLWNYLAQDAHRYGFLMNISKLKVLPVQGKDTLYSADKIVRLGEKKLLESDDDWNFLSRYLLVLNPNWTRFLTKRKREADDGFDDDEKQTTTNAMSLLRAQGLDQTCDANTIMERVTGDFFSQQQPQIEECVRLAHISAKLGVKSGALARFYTRDGVLRPVSHQIIHDRDNTLEIFFPDDWLQTHFLHTAYYTNFTSCSRDEWIRWVTSMNAGLLEFVPLLKKSVSCSGREKIRKEIIRRQKTPIDVEKVYYYLTIDDCDFSEKQWTFWNEKAILQKDYWAQLTGHILRNAHSYPPNARRVTGTLAQLDGRKKTLPLPDLFPDWILKLHEKPCLLNTQRIPCKPDQLLCRTPETEPLLGMEPFVDAVLDTESARPILLLLGVSDKPTGPDKIIDCIRALSKSSTPPVYEVDRLYIRLDQMFNSITTETLEKIKAAFHSENLILAENGMWTSGDSCIFISPDEEVIPGAHIIRSAVGSLALWRIIGIPVSPSADLALQWMKSIPSGQVLSQDENRRVQALLPKYPFRIWYECKHWLNLSGEWKPVSELGYSMTMQSLVAWSHLHEWVKQKTADFQKLKSDITSQVPFSNLPALASKIVTIPVRNPFKCGDDEIKPWLNQVGRELSRIKIDNPDEEIHIRALGAELSKTRWQYVKDLETISYIDEKPAGMAKKADVLWNNRIFYAEKMSIPKLARQTANELCKAFGIEEIRDAIKICFERSPEFVSEYFESNFILDTGSPNLYDTVTENQPTPEENSIASETDPSPIGEINPDMPETDVQDIDVTDDIPEKPHIPNPMAQKPTQSDFFHRFVLDLGFTYNGVDRFMHPDGSKMLKALWPPFKWQKVAPNGEVNRYYLPIEHCLLLKPMQIGVDVWHLIENNTQLYSLVLAEIDGTPTEYSGDTLIKLKESKKIQILPAEYRLVYNDN